MMSEKEKLDNGEIYNPNYDEELKNEILNAKEICSKYNKTNPREKDKRVEILKSLFGKTDGDFLIEQPFYCDYGYRIKIGKNFYANHNLVILDAGKVEIGDNVFIRT